MKVKKLKYRVAVVCDGTHLFFDLAENDKDVSQIENENSGFVFVTWVQDDWVEIDL